MNTSQCLTASPRQASVFLLTLVVTLVVAGVAMSMSQALVTRLHHGAGHQAQVQARQATLGILRAVVNDLNVTYVTQSTPQLQTVVPSGEIVGGATDASTTADTSTAALHGCSIFLIGRDPAGVSNHFGLISAAGLIDINHATAAVLAALPGMNEQIAAAIIDWRDADDEVDAAGGAERSDAYYQVARVPYGPRNAPFESVDELRMVRGVTDELWFGEDRNLNGHLDAGEDSNHNGQLDFGLRDLCCVEAREPATQANGEQRVPLMPFNQQVAEFLQEKIGEKRGQAAYQAGLTQLPFTSRLQACVAMGLSVAEADALWSACIGPEGRVGLLDVYSAPLPVLQAVCGLEIGQKIFNARPAASSDASTGTSTSHASAQFLADILNTEEIKTIGPLITSGSYQYTVDIFALRNDLRAWDRISAQLDCATGTTRVLGIRPQQNISWPFPWASISDLRNAGSKNAQQIIARVSGSQTW